MRDRHAAGCGGFCRRAASRRIFANILHSRADLFCSKMPTVFYCGDDRDAKSPAAELIRDAGLHLVDAGALGNARYIEPLAMLMLELGQSQRLGSNIALSLMNPAGDTELVKGADGLARSFVAVFANAHGFPTGESVLAEDLTQMPVHGVMVERAQQIDAITKAPYLFNAGANRQKKCARLE